MWPMRILSGVRSIIQAQARRSLQTSNVPGYYRGLQCPSTKHGISDASHHQYQQGRYANAVSRTEQKGGLLVRRVFATRQCPRNVTKPREPHRRMARIRLCWNQYVPHNMMLIHRLYSKAKAIRRKSKKQLDGDAGAPSKPSRRSTFAPMAAEGSEDARNTRTR